MNACVGDTANFCQRRKYTLIDNQVTIIGGGQRDVVSCSDGLPDLYVGGIDGAHAIVQLLPLGTVMITPELTVTGPNVPAFLPEVIV